MVRGGGFVDENETSFFVDADTMEELTFETGLLDEPTGVDFVAILAVMDWVAFFFGLFGFIAGEIDVFEEGTSAGDF